MRSQEIQLGHGSGGRMTAELIEWLIRPAFSNPHLDRLDDHAELSLGSSRLALTTDSFVVQPPFFPGGDIGQLAVHGTINDLAMAGSRPLYLSAAFILEEGFPVADLKKVIASMKEAAEAANVQIVTGDTKVVQRGHGDGIYINTTGIGLIEHCLPLGIEQARPGDSILVSGPIGDHGMAVLSRREGLEFEVPIQSDTAPLHELVAALLDVSDGIRCLRDPTRGGLATVLTEIAEGSHLGITVEESAIPIREPVGGLCELLGLDPLYVACEGRFVAIIATEDADRVLKAMQGHPLGREARAIGRIVEDHPGTVVMQTEVGGRRLVDRLSGEQLPRIC